MREDRNTDEPLTLLTEKLTRPRWILRSFPVTYHNLTLRVDWQETEPPLAISLLDQSLIEVNGPLWKSEEDISLFSALRH